MNILDFFDSSEFNIEKEIGSGVEGKVFETLNNKVIKFSVVYAQEEHLDERYYNISFILNHLKNNNISPYLKIHDFGFIGKFKNTFANFTENFSIHYYVTDKLNRISEDERKLFHVVLCHEDLNKKKNFSNYQIKKMLSEMHGWLDFDIDRAITFIDDIRDSQVIHNDIHVRNIMKDDFGKFYLIDYDGCKLKEV